jgi:hypothetical protein
LCAEGQPAFSQARYVRKTATIRNTGLGAVDDT